MQVRKALHSSNTYTSRPRSEAAKIGVASSFGAKIFKRLFLRKDSSEYEKPSGSTGQNATEMPCRVGKPRAPRILTHHDLALRPPDLPVALPQRR